MTKNVKRNAYVIHTEEAKKKKDVLKYARTQDKLTHEVLQKELFDDESQQTKR